MKKAIITILGLVCAVLMGYGIAHSETTIYATAESAGAGYDAGYGISASHTHRLDDLFAVSIGGSYALQHKQGAKDGYTYGLNGSLRAYIYEPWYLFGGYSLGGYNSKFSDGKVWKKQGYNPKAGAGYDSDRLDFWASYLFKENNTPNKVEAVNFGVSFKPIPDKGLKLRISFSKMWFEHSNKRISDKTASFGIGWEF